MPSTTSIFLNICTTQLQDTALVLKSNPDPDDESSPTTTTDTHDQYQPKEVILTNNDLLEARNKGRVHVRGVWIRVYSSFRNQSLNSKNLSNPKLAFSALLSLVVPTMTLIGAIFSYFLVDSKGWDSIFPSPTTNKIVLKIAAWGTLLFVVAYEHSFHWYGSASSDSSYGNVGTSITSSMVGNGASITGGAGAGTAKGNVGFVGLEVQIEEALFTSSTRKSAGGMTTHPMLSMTSSASSASSKEIATDSSFEAVKKSSSTHNANAISTTASGTAANTAMAPVTSTKPLSVTTNLPTTSTTSAPSSTVSATSSAAPTPTQRSITPTVAPNSTTNRSTPTSPPSHNKNINNISKSPSYNTSPTSTNPPTPTRQQPPALPFRFIRAEKGNIDSAKKRWAETLQWRKDLGMDTILSEPHPMLAIIKENYPHFFHLRGKKNEPCYYEQPAKMKLAELKSHNIGMEELLRHYALCCEYMWTQIEDSEDGKSIYIIDLEGIGIRDFAGEVVDFVKKASSFTADHYPERSGGIFVINVPSWFSVIWNVVKPMVDEVTKKKIKILRSGKTAITAALQEKIPLENIPPEYGGTSMKLGYSPEEIMFRDHFAKLTEQEK